MTRGARAASRTGPPGPTGAARFLIALSLAGLLFAWATGDIHRQGLWQGSVLVILAGAVVLAARTAPSTPTLRRAGKALLAASVCLTGALLVARQANPAAANGMVAAGAALLLAWLALAGIASRPTR